MGLLERLREGAVICAEGYLFEFERRGYLQAGAFVPEIVIEHPELVAQQHRDFVHAGSDVVEAFTYYGHREKLRLIGKEHLLEKLNRDALRIAKEVADEHGALVAGNICNTSAYIPGDKASHKAVRAMFDEQIGWAVEAGVDFIIGETYSHGGEALLALEAMKQAKVPSVVTLAVHKIGTMREGWSVVDTCKRLEDNGADVVGLNCARGPKTMMPLLSEIRAALKGHIAALPVPYRTTDQEPSFQVLTDPHCDCLPSERAFPVALDPFTCNRYEIAQFGKAAYGLGVNYLGVCCGAGPHHIRALAEALGRNPPASRYSADMSKHYILGSNPTLRQANLEYAKKL
ncbi:MAG: homocysteine S-methyltransferase family protein [Proteobacteria bacterium]|nr:homocysteine S-methyltransferase family protein [Pseudomonadota bacterium]MBI3497147.1 homocysteine S-methyltransferase family protein [Pseudomonadota bacterium]